jgi:hypothetical protein
LGVVGTSGAVAGVFGVPCRRSPLEYDWVMHCDRSPGSVIWLQRSVRDPVSVVCAAAGSAMQTTVIAAATGVMSFIDILRILILNSLDLNINARAPPLVSAESPTRP